MKVSNPVSGDLHADCENACSQTLVLLCIGSCSLSALERDRCLTAAALPVLPTAEFAYVLTWVLFTLSEA